MSLDLDDLAAVALTLRGSSDDAERQTALLAEAAIKRELQGAGVVDVRLEYPSNPPRRARRRAAFGCRALADDLERVADEAEAASLEPYAAGLRQLAQQARAVGASLDEAPNAEGGPRLN